MIYLKSLAGFNVSTPVQLVGSRNFDKRCETNELNSQLPNIIKYYVQCLLVTNCE